MILLSYVKMFLDAVRRINRSGEQECHRRDWSEAVKLVQ